jgi:hypothetical protein
MVMTRRVDLELNFMTISYANSFGLTFGWAGLYAAVAFMATLFGFMCTGKYSDRSGLTSLCFTG